MSLQAAIDGALPELRREAEARMTSTCTVRRITTRTTQNESTGEEVPVWDVVYTGRFRLGTSTGNSPTRTEAVDAVREALALWEARIDVLAVTADFDPAQPSLLLIRIDYRIRANNALANLVYPFYINESYV